MHRRATQKKSTLFGMKTPLLMVVIALAPDQSPAAEFKLVHRHGEPIADRTAGWNGHIEFASWVDEEYVVFASRSGEVVCISLDSGKVKWSLDNITEIQDWSVSRKTRRLAYLTGKKVISVVDCDNGKPLLKADSDQLARLLHVDFAIPFRVTISPDDGRLIVCLFSTFYGRNGYILDSSFQKMLSSFHVDASASELSMPPSGARIAVVADKDVLCVRDLTADQDVFFCGVRIAREPESFTFTIDAPFFSHLRDGGGDTIVYTEDNSWGTGTVFVHNITTQNVKQFGARNGHIELDVAFPAQRIVLTGTSKDLTLVDFDGKVLAHQKGATQQRNSCVEFSPNGQRILVGSWDNTISIFRILE
jgi:WD40 repeat protein